MADGSSINEAEIARVLMQEYLSARQEVLLHLQLYKLLAAAAGWHLSALYPLYCLARDLLLPVLFIKALRSDDFVWRGNEMQVERMRPRRMIARVRPRLIELAPRARQRLRSFRARMS